MENQELKNKIQDTFIIPKIKDGDMRKITAGNINSTYKVETKAGKNYLLQKINKTVFTKPEEVMQNIRRVSRWLQKKVEEEGGDSRREVLHPINTLDGTRFFVDENGEYWRMYRWIEGAKTYNSIEEAKIQDNIDGKDILYKVGAAFGKFQKRLADYPTQNPKMALHEAIPDFHNTPKRFSDFEIAVLADKSGRLQQIKGQKDHPLKLAIDKILSYEKELRLLEVGKASGELPIRVTHNDTKINNIMIDENSGEAICVIDLDTVGPDTLLVDFGDAIRSGANPAGEEPENIKDAVMDIKLFEAYTNGYLEETLVTTEHGNINTDPKVGLTQNEISLLHKAPKILTLELAMRFLGDYLNGDEYFRLKEGQPEDLNLKRALVQLHLAEDMNIKESQMKEIVDSIVNEKIKKETTKNNISSKKEDEER